MPTRAMPENPSADGHLGFSMDLDRIGNDLDYLCEYGKGFTPAERLSIREARSALWRVHGEGVRQ